MCTLSLGFSGSGEDAGEQPAGQDRPAEPKAGSEREENATRDDADGRRHQPEALFSLLGQLLADALELG